MKSIKIFGERNCGTNYLERLIELNFDQKILKYIPSKYVAPFLKYEFQTDWLIYKNRSRDLGWKHGVPHLKTFDKSKNIEIITITKNPYSFLLSLHKRPYHYQGDKNLNFEKFIRAPWQTIIRDNSSKVKLNNPIELWNLKNRSYRFLNQSFEARSLNLRYEDFIDDFEKPLALVSNKFNYSLKNEEFRNVNSSTKNDKKTFSNYQKYYQNELWKKDLFPESINYINKHLDKDLMVSFGYDLL